MKSDAFVSDIPPRFADDALPPPELDARVLSAIRRAPTAGMRLSKRLAIATLLLPILAMLPLVARDIFFGRSTLRADIGELPGAQLIVEIVGVAAVTFGATLAATRPGRTGLGFGLRTLAFSAVAVAPAFAIAQLFWPLRGSDTNTLSTTLNPWGAPCIIVAAVSGAAVFAVLAWALRGAVPAATRARGAVIGAASGGWAALALFIHCPGCAVEHVLTGHILPIVVFTCVGLLLGPPLLSP